MRAAWLVVVAVLALAGCSAKVSGAPAKDDAPRVGPVDLVVPIEVRPVLENGGADKSVLVDPSNGERITLDDPIISIEKLDSAEIKNDPNAGGWVLLISMIDKDARTFGDWTTDHTGERLALVIDGEVVVAPTIQSAITGGDVQIAGNYTRDDIERLLDKITGRG